MKFSRGTLAFALLTVSLSMGVVLQGAEAGTFTPTTGLMTSPRTIHTATLLPDGRVLITGGQDDLVAVTNATTAETFNPDTGIFSVTQGDPIAPRTFHTATLLSNGTVLITGGDSAGGAGSVFSSAEIFDPYLDTFSATTGAMTTPRAAHTATRLQDGKVLITGGSIGNTILSSAEIFDPATETFSPTTGSMGEARTRHTATLLADGRVLVAGGIGAQFALVSTAEIFDPTTGMFTPTVGPMTKPRGDDHTATLLLPSGQVVLVGGMTLRGAKGIGATQIAELYNPNTNTFKETTKKMLGPRTFHSAVLLSDGSVLITGGRIAVGATFRAEIYDPNTETFTETGHMTTERAFHTSTRLDDGSVLITGGFGKPTGSSDTIESSAEIFTP